MTATNIPVIVHVPHASAMLPALPGFTSEAWLEDIVRMTDWGTHLMVQGFPMYQATRSRVWCDMERFPDTSEPLCSQGHGHYRSRNLRGLEYRGDSQQLEVLAEFERYHRTFGDGIQAHLVAHPAVLIVDVHSFEDRPEENYPDICVGVDVFHTPVHLAEAAVARLELLGYSTKVNYPFEGTFVPYPLYQKKRRVLSIMLEVNKRVYMKELPGDLHQRSYAEIVAQCEAAVVSEKLGVLAQNLSHVVRKLEALLNAASDSFCGLGR